MIYGGFYMSRDRRDHLKIIIARNIHAIPYVDIEVLKSSIVYSISVALVLTELSTVIKYKIILRNVKGTIFVI